MQLIYDTVIRYPNPIGKPGQQRVIWNEKSRPDIHGGFQSNGGELLICKTIVEKFR